jgi:alkylhydroperoxidase family enzyme
MSDETNGRIELLSLEASRKAAEAVGVSPTLQDKNIFRLLLRRPQLAKSVNDLLFSLLFGGALDDRLRELVIMRIGWATGSNYEWSQHWTVAQAAFGCSPEDLLAVRDWRGAERFGEPERAALAATDETLATGTISAKTWALCERHLGGPDECLELVAAIGAWRMISQLARSSEIPNDPDLDDWPPDGVAAGKRGRV